MVINDRKEAISQVSSLEITIHPYWADTWWFRIGSTLVLLLILAAVLKLWFDSVQKRNRMASENALQVLELEARALNAQMNPHFIFNSLNAIQYLMNGGQKDKANIYLASFGKLIRLNLEAVEKSTISLGEELDRLEYYLSLERLRLPNLITYHFDVDSEIHSQDIQVPSMILQPFVENAIWHGILPAKRPGTVSVTVEPYSLGQIRIVIRDNGIGIEQSRAGNKNGHTSIGIELVRRRLELSQRTVKGPVLSISEIKSAEGESMGTTVEIVLILT